MWKRGNKEVTRAFLEYKIRTNYEGMQKNQGEWLRDKNDSQDPALINTK